MLLFDRPAQCNKKILTNSWNFLRVTLRLIYFYLDKAKESQKLRSLYQQFQCPKLFL
jgi:hypothetical protein